MIFVNQKWKMKKALNRKLKSTKSKKIKYSNID